MEVRRELLDRIEPVPQQRAAIAVRHVPPDTVSVPDQ
jgi:hypothetical protein